MTLALAACGGSRSTAGAAPQPGDDARRLNALADDYFTAWARTFPVTGVFSGVPEAPNDRLDDNSLGGIRRWRDREDGWLSQLQAIRWAVTGGRVVRES